MTNIKKGVYLTVGLFIMVLYNNCGQMQSVDRLVTESSEMQPPADETSVGEPNGEPNGESPIPNCGPGYSLNTQNECVPIPSGGDPGPVSSNNPRSLNDDVFFVGHSLVNTDMPEMVRKSLRSQDGQGSVNYQIINGAPLSYSWNNSSSAQGMNYRSSIPGGQYEVVVITEAVPLLNHLTYSDSHLYASNFYNLAVESGPTQVYLYETWHCINSGTSQGCAYDTEDNVSWRSRLDSDLSRWEGIADAVNNQKSSGELPMLIVPAGQAMAKMFDEIAAGRVPGINTIDQLFTDDIHNNDLGLYFISMVQYATLYRRSPLGLPIQLTNSYGVNYTAPSASLALKMQQIAWEVVCSYPRSGVNCQ